MYYSSTKMNSYNFGVVSHSQFFCCMLVVIVAQVAAGAWAYHNRDKLDDMVRSSVKNTVQNDYSVIPSTTDAFDALQYEVTYVFVFKR